jgi:hypothetical protein
MRRRTIATTAFALVLDPADFEVQITRASDEMIVMRVTGQKIEGYLPIFAGHETQMFL